MGNFLTFVIVFFSFTFSWAQITIESYDTVEFNQELIVTGGFDYSASSIEKDIMSKFYRGGVIDNSMKERSLNKHENVNRIGLDVGAEVFYRNFTTPYLSAKNLGVQIQFGAYNFSGILYSDDLFGLAFYGNEMYLGDTIDFSGTNVSFTSFQKVGFGLINATTKSSLSLNVYNISNRVTGGFRGCSLSQSTDGMNVNLTMDGFFELRQSAKFSQGLGVGLDLDYRFSLPWCKNRAAHIQFLAKNVGVGFMTEPQRKYRMDTTIEYSGFRFDQIIGDNAILSAESAILLDSLGIESTDVKSVFMLPGFIQVGKMIDENSQFKVQTFFGARIYPSLIYNPFIYGGIDFKPFDWLHAGASASFGGFAGFKTGLYVNLNWNKIQAGFGTDNIVGLVHKSGNGESFFIRLKCRL